jgi:DMSO/TMAO reductase YedYZ heme-binding membrane subunit
LLAVTAAPFLLMWNAFSSGDGAIAILSRLWALLAVSLIFLELMTGSFRPLLLRYFGFFPMRRLHVALGLAGLSFALLHFFFLVPALGEHFSTDNKALFIFGPIVLGVMIVTVGTALLAVMRGMLTSSWGWLHLLNYVIFVMAIAHGLVIGTEGTLLATRVVFGALLAFALAGFVYRARVHDWRKRFRFSPKSAPPTANV